MGDGDVDLLQEGEYGRYVQPVLLPKEGIGQFFDGQAAGGQAWHLEADNGAVRVDGQSGWSQDGWRQLDGQIAVQQVAQFSSVLWCGVMVEFNGRFLIQPKHHSLAARLDELRRIKLNASVVDENGCGHGWSLVAGSWLLTVSCQPPNRYCSIIFKVA